MRVLLAHSDARPFEVERFTTAWLHAGGHADELQPITPSSAGAIFASKTPVDGLLLTGGPDVEPWRYWSMQEHGLELHVDPTRDGLDLDLLGRADDQRWPVLGICYGSQILAVSYGCSLIQSLERVGKPGHSVSEPKDYLAHDVIVRPQSLFLVHCGKRFPVNTRHRQAVAAVGNDLVVAAVAPDGVIEAVERHDGGRFILGVQWHPENLATQPNVELFRQFRAACGRRERA
jgi:putative glutamine amidotransferase